MTPCECCTAARDWPGTVAARNYSPACPWCGARYLKLTPRHGRTRDGRPFTADEAKTELRRILAVWTTRGHNEAEIRALMKSGELPLQPLLPEPAKRGR